MNHFYSIADIEDPEKLVEEAMRLKANPERFREVGKHKSICLIFFNPSLRTRLSTVRAAENLGMNVTVFNVGEDGWQLEFEDGTIMNEGKAEHIKEAAQVIGSYFDMIGIRSFPKLSNREEDYQDTVIKQFQKYCGKPVISLESATLHPLQSFTDLLTIREYSRIARPKVVLTWAPHPRALPQAVPNSFAQWMSHSNVDFVITHPEGLELNDQYTGGITPEYDQKKAFEGAHFIYAKNWSSYREYGKITENPEWIIDENKMKWTNNAYFMHCLPIRRNVVATDGVLDHDNSLIIQQAGNRLWAAQTILKRILQND